MATQPQRKRRLELPAPPSSSDTKAIQGYLNDVRRITMDEFNRLSGDFFDFRADVIASATIPLASVAAITVDPGQYDALFAWENPVQPQGVPTHVRVRIAEFGDTWQEYTYPLNTITMFGLNPSTDYTFQIQLVRRETGTVSFVSALRNCPSIAVQVESLSEIRSRGFTTDSGIGVPGPDDDDDPVIPIPDTDDPGPVGGTGCWWEWQIQIVNLVTGEWEDTVHSGSVDGDAGQIDLTTIMPLLDPLRVYRLKIREVCNGIPGPWEYGPPFTGGSDWLDDCGGNEESASRSVAPYSSADLWAIPYACFVAGEGIRIRELISGIEVIRQFGFDLIFADTEGEWVMLADIWSNTASTKPLATTFLPVLETLDNSDDLSISVEIWMIDIPSGDLTPGGFGGGNILNIGGGRILLGTSFDANTGQWGVGFTGQREGGGAINLFSPINYPVGFASPKVTVIVTIDNDGDKILFIDGVEIARDTTGDELRLDGMTGQLTMSAYSNMFMSKVYGWNSVIQVVTPALEIRTCWNASGIGGFFGTKTPNGTVVAGGLFIECLNAREGGTGSSTFFPLTGTGVLGAATTRQADTNYDNSGFSRGWAQVRSYPVVSSGTIGIPDTSFEVTTGISIDNASTVVQTKIATIAGTADPLTVTLDSAPTGRVLAIIQYGSTAQEAHTSIPSGWAEVGHFGRVSGVHAELVWILEGSDQSLTITVPTLGDGGKTVLLMELA